MIKQMFGQVGQREILQPNTPWNIYTKNYSFVLVLERLTVSPVKVQSQVFTMIDAVTDQILLCSVSQWPVPVGHTSFSKARLMELPYMSRICQRSCDIVV